MNQRITNRHDGHWLTFDYHRGLDRYVVTGCHCGFRADLDADCGWGDSVVDHIWNAARLAARAAT